jgi:hypothetical protein
MNENLMDSNQRFKKKLLQLAVFTSFPASMAEIIPPSEIIKRFAFSVGWREEWEIQLDLKNTV